MTPPNLEKIMDYALSGEDVQRLVGKIRFVKYPDLDQETLSSLFKPRKEVVVLFLTKDTSTGHWICALEHPNKVIEIFDSYGLTPDGHRKKISEDMLEKLDQKSPQFADLFKTDPSYKLVYNEKALQKQGVATCGRHIAVRIMHKHMNLQEYLNLVENSGMDPDLFVTMVTYEKLKK